MVSFTYIDEADLSKLEAAAKAWSKLPSKYEGLEDQFESRVIKVLEGNWEGEAATTAFRTMKRATQEYRAAAEESRRVGKLLTEAHTEFRRHQKRLHELIEQGRKNYLKFSDKGVQDVDPRWDSPTASAAPGFADERKKVLDEATAEYKSILAAVTSIDGAVGAALRRDANGAGNDSFNGKRTYKNLDEAEAGKASHLMKKKGRLSESEFMQLNQLLAQNKNDPEFARSFAVRTGAEQTLDKYNQLINPAPGTHLSKADIAQLKQFQKNLGTTIGTATTSDDGQKQDVGIKKFQDELRGLGNRDFNANPTKSPYGLSGYQVASSLMSHGDWDDKFLTDYGSDLIEAEQRGTGSGFQNPDALWSGNQTRTAGMANLGALDPMAGFTEALGHNPGASTDFLSSSTTIDGEKVDHLDYLLKDRHWPEGAEYTGDRANPSGYDNLGHALESATSGRSYEYDGKNFPEHTEKQAKLVDELVTKLGGDDIDLIQDKDAPLKPLRDSLGNITANYMGDFQQGLTDRDDLPLNGAAAGLDRADTVGFLSAVGKDPDAYQAISASQQAYTHVLVDEAVKAGTDHPENSAERVRSAVHPGSYMAGIMSEARAEAVYTEKSAEATDFNSDADLVNKWVGRAMESIQTVPVAGWVIEDVRDSAMQSIRADNSKEAADASGERYIGGEQQAQRMAEEAVKRAARTHDVDEQTASDMMASAKDGAQISHSAGATASGARHGD